MLLRSKHNLKLCQGAVNGPVSWMKEYKDEQIHPHGGGADSILRPSKAFSVLRHRILRVPNRCLQSTFCLQQALV